MADEDGVVGSCGDQGYKELRWRLANPLFGAGGACGAAVVVDVGEEGT